MTNKLQPTVFLITDFEATCLEDNQFIDQEIIEFPIHIMRKDQPSINKKESFHSYVRPTINPKLSDFCKNLTGITQEQVDKGVTFENVLKSVHQWLFEKGWVKSKDLEEYQGPMNDISSWPMKENLPFLFVTDGPWDFRNFLQTECRLKNIPVPHYFKYWLNLRNAFKEFYGVYGNIPVMLNTLGLTLEGNLHSGFDDAYNISRILERMIEDGYIPQMNDSFLNHVRGHRSKRLSLKFNNTLPNYVGLLWIQTVTDVISLETRKEAILKKQNTVLEEKDPVISISIDYIETKKFSCVAKYTSFCNIEKRLDFLEESLRTRILHDVRQYYKIHLIEMEDISHDEMVHNWLEWAKNKNFIGSSIEYNPKGGHPKASNCLLTHPDSYLKLLNQLEVKPYDRYLYRVSSIPEYVNRALGIYPFPINQINILMKVTNDYIDKNMTSKDKTLKVITSILKCRFSLPNRIIDRLPKLIQNNNVSTETLKESTENTESSVSNVISVNNSTSTSTLE